MFQREGRSQARQDRQERREPGEAGVPESKGELTFTRYLLSTFVIYEIGLWKICKRKAYMWNTSINKFFIIWEKSPFLVRGIPEFHKAIVRELAAQSEEVLTESWKSPWSLEREDWSGIGGGRKLDMTGTRFPSLEKLCSRITPRPFHCSLCSPASLLISWISWGLLGNQHLVSLVGKRQVLGL